ncbi:MAG: ClpXP protease specificity-enhancing factor [Rhodoferax sp.]
MTSPSISTRPYLIRALYEWCADNGFTPFIAVAVDASVRVPAEYVKDGEIVLNISMDATSGLQIGNESIEFKGRFGGVARDIYVPIHRVLAIYARENGQGMAFPLLAEHDEQESAPPTRRSPSAAGESRPPQLKGVPSPGQAGEPDPEPTPPRPGAGARPTLTRVK